MCAYNNYDRDDWIGPILLSIFFFVGGCVCGTKLTMHRAIQERVAHYNPTNGRFTWGTKTNDTSTIPSQTPVR